MGLNGAIASVWPAAFLLVLASVAGAEPREGTGGFVVTERVHDEHGRVVWEYGHMAQDEDLGFARHVTHAKARPGGGGGADPGTDCESDAYRKAAWRWDHAYSATASSYANESDTAGNTWDGQTAADIFGSVSAGSAGTAGVQDGVNQLDWVDLGGTSTIAVTTTWYFIGSGLAVESDGQYNTQFAWATDGTATAMDVENIVAHEIGHTFGLDHPKGKPGSIGCLTLYAYGSEGELQKRSLGDGDVLGIRAIYGA